MPLEQSAQLLLALKLSELRANKSTRIRKRKRAQRGPDDNATFATQSGNCGQNRLISAGK
jgi:hypothetical protein